MAGGFSTRRQLLLAIGIAHLAVFYQWFLKDIIFNTYGWGRVLQPLSSFPYTCHRLTDPSLHACEDMWLNSATRTLYLACSTTSGRQYWQPNIGRLDAPKRSTTDRIIALDLESDPQAPSYKTVKVSGYANVAGNPELHLVGMTGHHVHSTGITYLYLVNHSPMYNMTHPHPDPTLGHMLPNKFTGANSTIEMFATSAVSDSMQHIRTFYHHTIATPNNVAFHPQSNGFYITNDHGVFKAGIGHTLSPVLGTGDLTYCSAESEPTNCTKVAGGMKFPNGLHLSPSDGYLYVPSAVDGSVRVYRPEIKYPEHDHGEEHAHGGHGHSHDPKDAPYYDGSVELVTTIKTGYPIDNISEDADGNIFAAALPNQGILKKFDNLDVKTVGAALKLKKGKWVVTPVEGPGGVSTAKGYYEYEVEKVLEDDENELKGAWTTVVRDAMNGRFWMSGVVDEGISVCLPK